MIQASILQDWWGLSLTHTLLALALLLVLVDVFFVSDIPTLFAYVLIAVVVSLNVPVQILYRVIIGVLSLFALITFHYLLWRRVLVYISNTIIAPTRFKQGAEGLVGSQGTIKEISGKKMVSIRGDLWPFECVREPVANARVIVLAEKDGTLQINIINEEG